MNELLNELNLLTKQSHLHPAEQIITEKLLNFENILTNTISEEIYESFEQSLINLLFINGGNLSLPCSIRISNCLISFYNLKNSPKIWNLITFVTKKPNYSNIIAIGSVIREIGQYSKSMLPGLVKNLLKLLSKFPISCLYTLNQCFKVDQNGLNSYALNTFNSILTFCSSKDETEQLLTVKLLRCLLKSKIIPLKLIYSSINLLLKDAQNHFVIDETCYYIARVAFTPFLENNFLNENNSKSEWNISKRGLKDNDIKLFEYSFQIISKFNNYFDKILKHFLNLINPEIIHKNLPILFEFVRNNMPSEIVQLITLFGHDVRKELFNKVSLEQPPDRKSVV